MIGVDGIAVAAGNSINLVLYVCVCVCVRVCVFVAVALTQCRACLADELC